MLLLSLAALLCASELSRAATLPQYVLEYAPLLYLHSEETFWPSDVSEHLKHVRPMRNGTVSLEDLAPALSPAALGDPSLDASNVFLTSTEDHARDPPPAWLHSAYGRPDSDGKSAAPVICVVVDKSKMTGQSPEGDLDAFWFTFFSYSGGLSVPQLRKIMGSHVGDWEHSMIRFKDGKPVAAYVSRHGGGSAFPYEVLEKQGKRPVFYIAKSSHATYAHTGRIDFASTGMIFDETDKGVLLDPALNVAGFLHQPAPANTYEAVDGNDLSTAVLTSKIIWGDKALPESDARQSKVMNFFQWPDGPSGPFSKNLARTSMGPRPMQQLEKALPQSSSAKVAEPVKPDLNKIFQYEKQLEKKGEQALLKQQREAAEREAIEAVDRQANPRKYTNEGKHFEL